MLFEAVAAVVAAVVDAAAAAGGVKSGLSHVVVRFLWSMKNTRPCRSMRASQSIKKFSYFNKFHKKLPSKNFLQLNFPETTFAFVL